MRMILLAAAATSLAACQTADPQPQQRSARAQATYDSLLAGKVAGRPQNCLPMLRSNDMQVIDDDTILYRDGRTTYVNQPLGSCTWLGRGSYALVTRSFLGALLRDSGRPALLVAHDARDVLALAQHVVVLERGKVVHQGTVEELAAAPATELVAELLGSV